MTTLVDIYPSRDSSTDQSIITRQDPVVHQDKHQQTVPGPLSVEQLTTFDEKGYLLCPGLIGKEQLQSLHAEANKMRHQAQPEDDRVVLEPRQGEIRSIFEVHKQSQEIAGFCASEPLAGAARQILASEVYLHQTRLNFKPCFSGKEFYWHSDFETWHVEDGMPRMRALSCVVALTDNHEFNGPLMIVPHSHRLYIRCQGETPENHYKQSLVRQEYGVPSHEALSQLTEKWGIDTLTGPAGTVVFFDCNAMHGSNSNITPFARHNLFFVFNSMENTLTDPFCGLKPRPEHIAARTFNPI